MPPESPSARIALLLQHLGDGGVERCFLNLARGFAERGIGADLYLHRIAAEGLLETSPGAALVRLPGRSPAQRREELASSLSARGASVVLTAKEEDFRLISDTRRQMIDPPESVMVASLDYTGQLLGRRAGPWRRWQRYRQVRRLFGPADRVFCVSEGVAQDMAQILQRPLSELPVLPNPVVTPELERLSHIPLDHRWLLADQPPLVLGVGRLSRIKNFPLLLRAFAKARREQAMHLMILGEGKQRPELLRLAHQLGIAEDVELPGFQANPYPYMRGADLFALSSSWEGFGNVLVEAMACGTPVASTDCPSGPSQILQGGRYGALVPVDNDDALARAILTSLRNPPPAPLLAEAIQPYTLHNSVSAYLLALGFTLPPADLAAKSQL
jgi:glycosyltransferase involved in cell wall biosynthesis